MTTGELIKKNRIERGWSNETLAKLIEVHVSTVSGWQVGRSFPNDQCIESMASVFHCDVDDLKGNDYEERSWKTIKDRSKKSAATKAAKKTMINSVDITYTGEMPSITSILQERGETINDDANNLDEQAEKINQLRKRIKYLDGIIEDKDETIKRLMNELDSANNQPKDTKEIQELKAENDSLNERIKEAERNNARMTVTIVKLMMLLMGV